MNLENKNILLIGPSQKGLSTNIDFSNFDEVFGLNKEPRVERNIPFSGYFLNTEASRFFADNFYKNLGSKTIFTKSSLCPNDKLSKMYPDSLIINLNSFWNEIKDNPVYKKSKKIPYMGTFIISFLLKKLCKLSITGFSFYKQNDYINNYNKVEMHPERDPAHCPNIDMKFLLNIYHESKDRFHPCENTQKFFV